MPPQGGKHDSDGEFGSLTHYDYGFRIYNPSIGKFLSVDPLTSSYPWYTPYQFAGNTPIWAIDLDGLEPQYSNSGSTAQDNSPAQDNLPAIIWDNQVNKQYLVDLKEFSTSTHTQIVSSVEVFEPGSEPRAETPKLGEPYRENVLMYNQVWSRTVLDLPAQGKIESTNLEFEVIGSGIALKQMLSASSKMIIRAEAMKDGLNVAKTSTSWAKTSGILQDAVKGKGNYGLGSGTVDEAMQAGRSWVGEGFTISKDGSSWISANGLRQFRPPSFKPKLGIEQANFQWRNVNKGAWQSNGHLDIIKP